MTKNKLKLTLNTIALLILATLTINIASAQLHVTKNTDPALNGAVGIGTDIPTEKLDVDGSINISGGFINTGSSDLINDKGEIANNSIIRVGANRTKKGTARIDLFPYAQNADGTNGFVGRFLSNDNGATTFAHNGTGPFVLQTFKPGSRMIFRTWKLDNSGFNPYSLIIDKSGFVGIRNTNPEAELDVKGNTLLRGNVGIGGETTGIPDGNARLSVDGTAKKPGGGEFETTSDKRTKKNINQYEAGLQEVLKLNPVTYNYNGKAGISNTEKKHVGLIAQEFAEIAPYAINKFNFKEEGSNKTEEYMSLDASSIKYMLVNAIKEQQAKIESLEEKLSKVAANSAVANPTENELSVLLEGTGTEKALLAQNMPNPFTTNTRIEYFVPANSRHCSISFRDMNGKELKQVDIEHDGIGAIELSSKDLAAGIYSYVLYVNGDIVASKKMILKQ